MTAAECDLKRAALKGEWEDITNRLLQWSNLGNDVISFDLTGDTLFHICAQCGRTDVMKELLKVMPGNVLHAKNVEGNTALHEAVRIGNKEMAEVMLEKEEGLLSSRNVLGETPIYWAAMYGHKEMLLFLSSITSRRCTNNRTSTSSIDLRRNDGSTILHAAVVGEFYGVAMEILDLYPRLAWNRNEEGCTASHILALTPSAFKSRTIFSYHYVGLSASFLPLMIGMCIYAVIPIESYETSVAACRSPQQSTYKERCKHNCKSGIKWIFRGFSILRFFYNAKEKHTYIMQLIKKLLEKDYEWDYASDGRNPWKDYNYNNLQFNRVRTTNKFTERPLILATKMGIIEMVKEIVNMFPESLGFVDEETGKNVFHLTVEHRHEYIMEWLRSMKKRDLANLVVGIDREGNSALHATAKLGKSKQWHIQGPMHHIQWECIWFERIKCLLPAHMITIKNSKNQTAKEVFTESHKLLVKKGEKWLKDVSNSCMVMSTLIATVVFASAFTVPGGNDEKTGLPVLLKKYDFTPFIQYAAISLFMSLLSLGLFLSIHTSRFNEEDFYLWLPLKTVVALTALFDSIIFTLASFSQAYVLVTGWKFSLVMTFFDTAIAGIGFYAFVLLYLEIILAFLRYLVDIVFI